MNRYDPERPYFGDDALEDFVAIHRTAALRYGARIKAIELANIEYKFRNQKLKGQKSMKPPPSSGRTFTGYLVVRKLGTPEQYETWMPDHVFAELYARPSS